MLFRVIAKNVGDVFWDTVYMYISSMKMSALPGSLRLDIG